MTSPRASGFAALSPKQRRVLEIVTARRRRERTASLRPAARASAAERPISVAEERMWFLDQLEPGLAVYSIPAAARLRGSLDLEALHTAFLEAVRRHETLRTAFISVNGAPRARILAPTLDFRVVDLTSVPARVREGRVRRLVQEDASRPFSLAAGHLLRIAIFRLASDDHVLAVTMHHVISDGWSIGVLVNEVAATYDALARGAAPPLSTPSIQYGDWAAWQRARLDGGVTEELLQYWVSQLSGTPEAIDLPTDRARAAVQSYAGDIVRFRLDDSTSNGLRALCTEEGVTLFVGLLSALVCVLSRWSGEHDVCVGSPVANRNHAELHGLIGLFVNTLVLRVSVDGDPSFRQLLSRTREVVLGALDHQELPFARLVEEVQPERDLGRNPLFQVMFALHNAPMDPLTLPGIDISSLYGHGFTLTGLEVPTKTSKFDLSVAFEEEPLGLVGTVEYSTELFDGTTASRLLGHLETLLAGAVAAPDRSVWDLPVLDEAERALVVDRWNQTAAPLSTDAPVHELFLRQAEATPDAIAVVGGARSLTYAELARDTERLARRMTALGVGAEALVGVSVRRTPEMAVGLLGVLRAGGAYVPLDPDYPPERLAFMVVDAQLQWIVTERRLAERLPPFAGRLIFIDEDEPDLSGPLDSGASDSDLAYVIYTSGSTGRPKGVMVEHRSLTNAHHAWEHRYGLHPGLVHLQVASLSFDVATGDVVRALCTGGRLVLCPTDVVLDPAALTEFANRHHAEVVELVPAVANLLVAYLLETGERISSLRTLIVGSDSWSPEDYAATIRVFGPPTECVNSFGVTEATVDTACFSGGPLPPEARAVPIGRPLANMRVYILDRTLKPVPIGVVGELCIGGAGVARGYLRRADLTSEKFVPDPFSDDPDGRLYRTGDAARFLADGAVELVGRIDDQVKIRGMRVELREVENALAAHPRVRAAAAAVVGSGPEKRLVGYVATGAESVAPEEIRAFVRRYLPDPMCPAAFVMMPEIPLSPNGKVDRRALLHLAVAPQTTGYVEPRPGIEQELATIWRETLGLDRVSADDNFFELGGHSLLATRVAARAEKVLGRRVPVRLLFEAATVADLAASLSMSGADSVSLSPILPGTREVRWVRVDGPAARVVLAEELQGK